MAFAALVAHRAIVRMVHHQPFDDAGAKLPRLGIIDRDAGSVRDWRHAGHDDFAAGVVFVLELFDRALAACAHRAQCRVPAEIREVEPSERQAGAGSRHPLTSMRPIIDMDSRHRRHLHGQRCSRIADRNRPRKYLRRALRAVRRRRAPTRKTYARARAGARELAAVPDPRLTLPLLQIAQDLLDPGQSVPARRAPPAGFLGEEVSRLRTMPDRTGLVVEDDHRAGAEAAAGLLHRIEIHGTSRWSAMRKSVDAPPAETRETGIRPASRRRALRGSRGSRAHRQFPHPGFFTLPLTPYSLVPPSSLRLRLLNHVGALVHDMRDVAQRFDVVDDGGLAPQTAYLADTAAWRADCARLPSSALSSAGLLAAHVAARR